MPLIFMGIPFKIALKMPIIVEHKRKVSKSLFGGTILYNIKQKTEAKIFIISPPKLYKI